MCGRYTLRNPERAFTEFSILERVVQLAPRYNVAPTQLVPIVRAGAAGRAVDLVRWGLAGRSRAPVIMVRAEAAVKGAFADSFRGGQRCIFLADGFYEWEQRGKERVPHHIRRTDDAPIPIAGIWRAATETAPAACAVLTRPAVAPLVDLHDRMPATVAREDYDRWLDPSFQELPALEAMLAVDLGLELAVAAVTSWVNAAAHDDPRCLEPRPAEGRP